MHFLHFAVPISFRIHYTALKTRIPNTEKACVQASKVAYHCIIVACMRSGGEWACSDGHAPCMLSLRSAKMHHNDPAYGIQRKRDPDVVLSCVTFSRLCWGCLYARVSGSLQAGDAAPKHQGKLLSGKRLLIPLRMSRLIGAIGGFILMTNFCCNIIAYWRVQVYLIFLLFQIRKLVNNLS